MTSDFPIHKDEFICAMNILVLFSPMDQCTEIKKHIKNIYISS